jgi:type II secretory pathway pseudopilin PulG
VNFDRTTGKTHFNSARGFSVIEVLVVILIIIVVSAIAIIQMNPSSGSSHADVAMHQVQDQLRQAREYAIENRRYVAVTFQTVGGQPQLIITQMNSQTAGAGADQVLSTIPIETPVTYCVCSMPDTPDGFGNGSPVYFERIVNGPPSGMWFQSDGELVDAATHQPIDGTVFLGIAGQPSFARAVTVMGTTGRVRVYKSTGSAWFAS